MSLSFQRIPGPGETRDCTDPWKFLILRADGDVCLCCRSPAVGNLRERPLDAILDGEPARAMRRELLAGELAEHCRNCCERGVTTPEALRRDVEALLAQDDRDVIEDLRAENRKLMQARADLFRERDALRGHATNLETERPHLLGHIANLEAEIARLQARVRELADREP
jgi:hypothetical protein